MCGISIILKKHNTACPGSTLSKMNDVIAHRGPDGDGMMFFKNDQHNEFIDMDSSDWHLGYGHRRLSIIDLSAAGHQPMVYRDRYWLTFNGELYNYIELKKQLEPLGYIFHTSSDTEVVLAAYAEWGLDCFASFNGMWSMSIYDTVSRKMILSRDRMGIKPLYIYKTENIIAACSEIKQLQFLPDFTYKVNRPFLAEYIQTGYEKHDQSFFQNILPLQPGTALSINVDTLKIEEEISFWDPKVPDKKITDPTEAGLLFRETLESSIEFRLRSDVPVGSFLSGGLDSSAIVSLISKQKNASSTINTFSAVFDGYEMDESDHIKSILDYVPNTKGHFTTPQFEDFNTQLEKLIWHNDEPVGGPSVFASYCVSRIARASDTTVILNGQGGDEILGGYWQLYYMHLLNALKKGHISTVLSNVVGSLGKNGNSALIKNAPFILKRFLKRKSAFSANPKMETQENNYLDTYLSLDAGQRRVNDIRNLFLPRLLKWEDRNTMAFSIEGRYPFLDYRLIELCLSFSDDVLYKAGWTKMPIRNGLKDVLPLSIINRKSKYGFEVPQTKWLDAYIQNNDLSKDYRLNDIIDYDVFQKHIETYKKTKQNDVAQLIFRLIFVQTWFKNFNLSL